VGGPETFLDTLLYGVKDSSPTVINNVSPGVFFYYSTLTVSAGSGQTIQINQSHSGTGPVFNIQQGQVKLYSDTCSNSIPNLSNVSISSDGNATITFDASATTEIIIGVKYSASSAAGQSVPSPATIQYHFETVLNSVVVNSNVNGLFLAPKP